MKPGNLVSLRETYSSCALWDGEPDDRGIPLHATGRNFQPDHIGLVVQTKETKPSEDIRCNHWVRIHFDGWSGWCAQTWVKKIDP